MTHERFNGDFDFYSEIKKLPEMSGQRHEGMIFFLPYVLKKITLTVG